MGYALRWSLSVVAGCLGNGRLSQQWACISVGAGCLGNGRLRQQWACISVGTGCLGNGGRPSPTEHLRDRFHEERLESPFVRPTMLPQTLCPCNPWGGPLSKSRSVSSSALSSLRLPVQQGTRTSAPCGECWLRQAEPLPGVPHLLYTWEFPRSVGNKDQSENAAPTHLSAD